MVEPGRESHLPSYAATLLVYSGLAEHSADQEEQTSREPENHAYVLVPAGRVRLCDTPY